MKKIVENSSKLINCKDCGHSISKNAKSCPNCGNEIKKSSFLGKLFKIVVILIVFLIVFLMLNTNNLGGDKDAASKYNKLLKGEYKDKPVKENKMTGECWDKINSYKNKYYTEECQKYREKTGDEEYQKWNEQRKIDNDKLLEVIERGSKY